MNTLALINLGLKPNPGSASGEQRTDQDLPPRRPDGPLPGWMRRNTVVHLIWQHLDDYDGTYYRSRQIAQALGLDNNRVAPVLSYLHMREAVDRLPLDDGSFAYARAQSWREPAC